MELETSSLTDNVTPETPAIPNGQEATPEAAPADAGTPAQQPTAQEIADWTKDQRYERMWKKDPNALYKSYREADKLIEGQYKPLRAQAETFTKLFKEYGYEADPAQIKQAMDELKTWKDPENPTIKRANYFSYFYDHPEYKGEVETMFEGLRKREIRKQFGDGVSDEIVNEIIANRKYREEQEAKEKARIEQEQHSKLVGTIDEGWKRVESEAKAMGFPVTEEIRQQLLEVCAKEDVDPRFMYYKFQDMFKDEVSKYRRLSVQSEQKKLAEKNKRAGIIPASSTPSRPVSKAATNPNMLNRVMERIGLKT